MRPSEVSRHLKTCATVLRPAFVHGQPGVGKSQVVKAAAQTLGVPMIDVRLSQLDAVDLRGLPFESNGLTKWATPDFLPRADRDGNRGILFFDEANAADKSVQAASYQIVLDRKLGDYTLPPGWAVVAAGNYAGDRAIVNKVSSALNNRFTHLDFEVDLGDWVSWALDTSLPDFLVAFIRNRDELLHKFDPRDDSKAFPTPRSWETAGAFIAGGAEPTTDYGLFAGTVGDAAATELAGYWRYFADMPDPIQVLMDPNGAKVPTEPGLLYAIATSLPSAVSPDRMDALCAYLDRLPPEFGVLAVRDTARRKPECQQTNAFVKWASKNKDVLM